MNSPLSARVLCACALAALAACSVGPAYKRPDIPLPSAWSEGPRSNDGSGIWPSSDWWHGFGSEKLNQLIAEAERNNDDLAVAIARVQEADAQARIAGAPLLPTLDLSADASRQHAQVAGGGLRTFNTFSPVLSASYELDFLGQESGAEGRGARHRHRQPL